MKKKLLIVDRSQFGNHVDTYKYSRLLQGHYDISFVCWDHGWKKLPEENTRVIYVSRSGNWLRRLTRYILKVSGEIRSSKFDLVLVVYFPLCSVFPLVHRSQRIILEIVTGYIRDNKVMKYIYDGFLYCESLFFSQVAVQSDSLRQDLRIRSNKSYILPVGADELNLQDKNFTAMRLLYVGTLDYRRIDETIKGFDRFYDDMKDRIELSYDIVGFGSHEQEKKLHDAMQRTGCKDLVRFYGRIAHDELTPFLEKNNVGVAFIPIKRHFDCQPATKVFEYLLSGMVVLATATKENQLVINGSNGVLIQDNADAVYRGLLEIYKNRGTYDSRMIKVNNTKYSWRNIICNDLRTYLDSFMGVTD